MKKVRLVTDGACKGNPGPGGWAAILRYKQHKRELYGCDPHTTNNRMELTAAVRGLAALKEPCEVEIITDSEYLKNGITQWLPRWKRNGWTTVTKNPVKNQDLWLALDEQMSRHAAHWKWTKGHSHHSDNNRADELASEAAVRQISSKHVKHAGNRTP
jgi:ribonuclease HI